MDELIVRFASPPTADALMRISAELPLGSWRAMNHVTHPKNNLSGVHPLASVRVVTVTEPSALAATAATLSARRDVVHVDPNVHVQVQADSDNRSGHVRPLNDPLLPFQWALDAIDAHEAWDAGGRGDNSIVVAIIDTGLNFQHEEFQGDAVWTNPGEVPDNGVDDDKNGLVDDYRCWDFQAEEPCYEDRSGHGTSVAGIIGARADNNHGIAGITNARMMVLNGLGAVSDIIEANYYAVDMGARVINFSISTGTFVEEWQIAIEYAWENDVLVVASAGNDGSSGCRYPAAFDRVMGVSATLRDDSLWEDSNHGECLDVAAPGGVGILTSDADRSDGYRLFGGTSAAAPHVAGLAALLRSISPELSTRKVRAFIRDGADDLGDPGFDELFGYGRINAASALALVQADSNCPADLNRDDTVEFGDVIVLLSTFGSDDWTSDVNDDGVIDFADILEMLLAWGDCP